MNPLGLQTKKWFEQPTLPMPDELAGWLAQFLGLADETPPNGLDLEDGALRGGLDLVLQTLLRRGLSQPEQIKAFLDPDCYTSASPYEIPGMQVAVQRLQQSIARREKILVWGDFDVDGQTSTTILVSTLRQLGALVDYHIPVRGPETHGIKIELLQQILLQQILLQQILSQQDTAQNHAPEITLPSSHSLPRQLSEPEPELRNLPDAISPNLQSAPVSLLLTCDTGISAVEAVDFANKQGLEVLVTDHHELPVVLPQALALVNPNFLPADHPLHTLPGVGVAYKLAEALFEQAGRKQDCEQFLDLAALGCVADVARLRGEARWLVQRGLKLLAERKRLGLRVMMENAKLPPGPVSEESISFFLAPRLNALGRLGDANPVVEFLSLAKDEKGELRARAFAAQLEMLNARRQLLTSQVLQAALAQVEQEPALLDDAVLALAHPAWPGGVVGIVASRLVDLFARPVILFSAPPDKPASGSARSIEGIDITAALTEAAPGLLLGFGGHAMAAGMSLPAERIPELRKKVSQAVLRQGMPEPSLAIDAYLSLDRLSLDFACLLERLAPFGAGNPDLVLASRNLLVKHTIRIGANQEHLRVILADAEGREVEALWWQSAGLAQQIGLEGKTIDLAYHAHPNTFNGKQRLQLTWVDFRPAEQPLEMMQAPQIHVEDLRQVSHPLPVLEKMIAQNPELAVFAEAEAVELLRKRFPALHLVNRQNVVPVPALAIWTPPSSRAALRALLVRAQPAALVLFAVSPQTEKLNPFLQRLAGLIKFALRAREGQVSLAQLAAAAAQGDFTVRLGLDWLAAKGHISIEEDQGQELRLREGQTSLQGFSEDAEQLAAQISVLLDEAAAFRQFFRRAEMKSLLDNGLNKSF